ncbi:MAG: hypothetical protein LC641_04325 [Spirochaeta sp.]|nr:hypothetical protein [Spirochaeta sp.]
MRIAMSCAGEGFGHVSRMISFAQGLQARHELVLFAPKSVQHHIRRSLPQAKVITIPYFHLTKKDDRILYIQTVRQNLAKAIRFRVDVRAIRRQLQQQRVQAVVSDYEPYLPAAARALDLPVLQVNHPGVVLQYPSASPDALIASAVARLMMGRFDRRLYVSFYNGDVGPILRSEFSNSQVTRGDYYVVYVKPTYRRRVAAELERLGVSTYRMFPNPHLNYAESLAGCKGVITGAGHQSLSEAITLGKPVFAIPQRGQYEQRINARMLVASGWGMKGRFSNLGKTLPTFIASIDRFPHLPQAGYQDEHGNTFRFVNDREVAVQYIENFVREYAGTGVVQRFIMNVQANMQHTLQALGLAG